MPCFLVEMLQDNCAEVIEDTQDLGSTATLLSVVACPLLTSVPTCTGTSTSPAGVTFSCTILNPTCTVVGYSPDNVNPALTNVLFAITYQESITVTESATATCTVTTGSFTRQKMVQLTTSTPALPLTYSCILDNYSCAARLVSEDATCHLVTNATFCVEFISTTTVKQEIASTACVTPLCDPFPPVACPPN